MRIAIFGGSFDPVHVEHIRVAQAAVKSLRLDKLIIMPAFAPPHKSRSLTDNAQRLALCHAAFSGVEKTEVSDYEISRGGVSYTFLTCQKFRQEYPKAELFFLVGTDMLRDFPTWKNPESILSDVTLAVCARNEQGDWLQKERAAFEEKFGKTFAVVGYNGADVSSTKIRVLAAAEEPINAYTGGAVAEYIQKNGLYKIDGAKSALGLEKQSRKAHSLRVAEAAATRAAWLDVPERQAIAAALFHDCAKNLPLDHEYLQGFTLPDEWGEVPESVAHQFAGAYVAEHVFGVKDQGVLNAIRYHTSGRENMSELEKLVFLADMVEDGRAYDGVEEIRAAFYEKGERGAGSLDKCLTLALQETVAHLRKKGGRIYPLTLSALQYYEEKEKKQ